MLIFHKINHDFHEFNLEFGTIAKRNDLLRVLDYLLQALKAPHQYPPDATEASAIGDRVTCCRNLIICSMCWNNLLQVLESPTAGSETTVFSGVNIY